MVAGSIVSDGKTIGTLLSSKNGTSIIVDAFNTKKKVNSSDLVEVCNPHALALIMYTKVLGRIL